MLLSKWFLVLNPQLAMPISEPWESPQSTPTTVELYDDEEMEEYELKRQVEKHKSKEQQLCHQNFVMISLREKKQQI